MVDTWAGEGQTVLEWYLRVYEESLADGGSWAIRSDTTIQRDDNIVYQLWTAGEDRVEVAWGIRKGKILRVPGNDTKGVEYEGGLEVREIIGCSIIEGDT